MVRVFISQPMQGKTSEQIRTEHNEWADRLGKLSNEEDLKAFLAEPENTKIGRRDRVLLALLYDTAVRVSELTGIVLGDMTLNVKNPSIIIYGKIIP